ncbi:hypothetical protein BEL04_17495 [Mucilaginibacter sp. PPCGB 2223]|nr:hypothetical protein BEL04_17495 [Mucilaginibacter sp. PPCGB 2223]
MNGNVYMLRTSLRHLSSEIIYSRDTALKVRVYNLSEVNFKADDNEIQLYGWCNEDLLAFETIDIQPEDAMDIIMAIKWYAQYVGCADMEILPDDPRQKRGHEIAV